MSKDEGQLNAARAALREIAAETGEAHIWNIADAALVTDCEEAEAAYHESREALLDSPDISSGAVP